MSDTLREGDVVERIFDGRAVRHWPEEERFHCLAYPCQNTTQWLYIPAWSHLCMECMMQREAQNDESPHQPKPVGADERSR